MTGKLNVSATSAVMPLSNVPRLRVTSAVVAVPLTRPTSFYSPVANHVLNIDLRLLSVSSKKLAKISRGN